MPIANTQADPLDNNLNFALNKWNAQARLKNVSYVIGQTVTFPAWNGDPGTEQPPPVHAYPLDRLDAGGDQTRLGVYPSVEAAQAAAQADANL